MEREVKVHLKRFAKRLKDALGIKTGWGRNELHRLIDAILIEYLVEEESIAMEEKSDLPPF